MAKKRRVNKWTRQGPDHDQDLGHILSGLSRTEHHRDGSWTVQIIGPGRSDKVYKCPGCNLDVTAGTAHVVTWRADDILGEQSALSARRHWHNHCWKVRN